MDSPLTSFHEGDLLQIKLGVRDPDFPQFGLGNWQGKVVEIITQAEAETLVHVRFTADSLASAHPLYAHFAELADLEFGEIVLPQDCFLVPSSKSKPKFEGIDLRWLKEFQDRVATLFSRLGELPNPEAPWRLPPFNLENVRKYQNYLEPTLTFPFAATLIEEEREVFVLVQSFAEMQKVDFGNELVCYLHEENRPRLRPLSTIVPHQDKVHALLEEYQWWLEGGLETWEPTDSIG
ncbi:Hypothetical protein PBC10988_39710 [Planctomycetales bacterium 10988]|nr:Hypothetical protein PBC10988_39710 [Planctomycetales bacterium 10988]